MTPAPDLDGPDRRGPAPHPSPVEPGAPIGDWTVGARIEVRGEVHLHASARPEGPRLAVWRYRGYEPLPRFLDQLQADAEAWSSFRAGDGRLTAVVPTVDVARIPGAMVFYWAQEDPRGPTLASVLEQNPLLAPAFALDLARQLGAALGEIHARDLVHGDLDPSNVHLAGSLDFARLAWGGLATRLEGAGMDVGRGKLRGLAEVAPEVLLGKRPEARSDLYALASLAYRILAGQPPWLVRRNGPLPGVTPDDPLPPLPEWVVAPIPELLAIGLQRDPDRRPDGVADWCDRLAEAQRAVEALRPPPGTWAPPDDSIQPAPPTVRRTLSPLERPSAPDRALTNAPLVHGCTPPTPVPTVRSASREIAPVATTLPEPERVVPPPGPRPAGPPLAPYALGAIMIAGFTAVLAAILCGLPWRTTVSTTPPGPIVITSPPPGPVEATAAAAREITVYSDPATAAVFREGEQIGVTPMGLALPAPDEPPLRLELRKVGYRTRTVEIGWDQAGDVVEQLVPRPPGGPEDQHLPGLRPRR